MFNTPKYSSPFKAPLYEGCRTTSPIVDSLFSDTSGRYHIDEEAKEISFVATGLCADEIEVQEEDDYFYIESKAVSQPLTANLACSYMKPKGWGKIKGADTVNGVLTLAFADKKEDRKTIKVNTL